MEKIFNSLSNMDLGWFPFKSLRLQKRINFKFLIIKNVICFWSVIWISISSKNSTT